MPSIFASKPRGQPMTESKQTKLIKKTIEMNGKMKSIMI